MALIRLKKGGTFFGEIEDYDWKGKYLVVLERKEDLLERRTIHWDNVESVFETIEKEEEDK